MGIRNGWVPALVAWGAILAVSACDPAQDAPSSTQDGPTFLTVIPAAVQPASPEDGVAMVVQARGGLQVGITTFGGRHRYGAIDGLTTSSCAELPGTEPLYVIVQPDDLTCVLEARLYTDCDPDDGGSALQMCMSGNGGFVTSVVVPVVGAFTHYRDGGTGGLVDAGAQLDGDAGALLDQRAEGAAPRDAAADANPDALRGDR